MLSTYVLWIIIAIVRADKSSKILTLDGSIHLDSTISCPSEWYAFGKKCYKGYGLNLGERLNWNEASEKCIAEHSKLVSIHSAEEQDFITAFVLLHLGTSSWIGLHDLHNESHYMWADGSEVKFVNWDKNEPSGPKLDEDCVEMVFKNVNSIGKWNDNSCPDKKAFICQIYQDAKYWKPNPVLCSSSNETGYRFQDSCYIPVKTEKSWKEAEDHCVQEYHGHLLTIRDFSTQKLLIYALKGLFEHNTYWIGIKFTGKSTLKWSSDWFVSYSNWEDLNIEKNRSKVEACAVHQKTGKWNFKPCYDNFPFVCEVSSTIPPTPLTPSAAGATCPKDGWKDLGGDNCYYFEFQNTETWPDANFKCMQKGGMLVSIHSEEEFLVLKQFCRLSEASIFIGLFRDEDGDFRWTDESEVNFTFWNRDEPNSKEEKCTEMVRGETLGWNDNSCNIKIGYICSINKVSVTLSTKQRRKESYCSIVGVSTSSVVGVAICVLVVVVLVIVFLYFCRPWEKEHLNHMRKISHDVLQAARPNPRHRSKTPELIIIDDSDVYDNPK